MNIEALKADVERELSEYAAGVDAYRDWMNEWRAKRGLPLVSDKPKPIEPVGFRCKQEAAE